MCQEQFALTYTQYKVHMFYLSICGKFSKLRCIGAERLRKINPETSIQSSILTTSLPKHNLKHDMIFLITDSKLGV
jgi:hypothetical protein